MDLRPKGGGSHLGKRWTFVLYPMEPLAQGWSSDPQTPPPPATGLILQLNNYIIALLIDIHESNACFKALNILPSTCQLLTQHKSNNHYANFVLSNYHEYRDKIVFFKENNQFI